MKRLTGIVITARRQPLKQRAKGTLTVDSGTARLVRLVQAQEGLDLTSFVDLMLRTYLSARHPDWQVTEEHTELSEPRARKKVSR